HAFTISTAALKDSVRERPSSPTCTRDGKPEPVSSASQPPTATVKNTRDQAVVLLYQEKSGQGKETVLRVPVGWSRWHPRHGWQGMDEETKEQGSIPYVLKPGESVKVVLPDWLLDGDGIYSYFLNVWNARDTTPREFLTQIHSEPFVVDRVRVPAAPAPEKK